MNTVQILKTYFGYDSFRKGQKDIIDSVLAGRDVMAVMLTGAGITSPWYYSCYISINISYAGSG